MRISLPAGRTLPVIAAVCLLAAFARASAADPARLVVGVAQDQDLARTFANPDAWKQARSHIGAMLFADHVLAAHGDQDLALVLDRLRQWHLPLELEVGAVKEWARTGDEAYSRQKPGWDRIGRFGGGIASFALDEPLVATRNRLRQTDEYAVAETARFIADVRKAYPNADIGDVEPYPGIDLAGHEHWVRALQARLRGMGVRGLDFYRLDVNWFAIIAAGRGDWREVKALEDDCHALRLPFSLIYWAADYPAKVKQNRATDASWHDGVMYEGRAFQAVGGRPDQYVIQSWVAGLPNDLPDIVKTTFMGTVLDFWRQYVMSRQ